MKSVVLTIPSFAFIVATRAALGVGVGLLASMRAASGRDRALVGATHFPRKGDEAFSICLGL